MRYRVVNATTGEVRAEFNGIDQFNLAMKLADDLAEDAGYQEQFIVIQSVTVYETATHTKRRMSLP
jgi:hypothetical protein